jgi:hypothetical protein
MLIPVNRSKLNSDKGYTIPTTYQANAVRDVSTLTSIAAIT